MFEQVTEKPLSKEKMLFNQLELEVDFTINQIIGETMESLEMLGLTGSQEKAVKEKIKKDMRWAQFELNRNIAQDLGIKDERYEAVPSCPETVTGVCHGTVPIDPITVKAS